MLTSIIRFIFLLFFVNVTLAGCMIYVSSDDADVVAAKITGGANDFNVCEEAAYLNKADNLIWRQGKQIWITEVKNRNLNCSTLLKAGFNSSYNASLKTQQQKEQKVKNNDTSVPLIDYLFANTSGKQGIIKGRARDNIGIAEVTVDGLAVQVHPDGRFEHRTFIPVDGKQILVEATDLAGLTSQRQLNLFRNTGNQLESISFDKLNPLGKRVAKNRDALALIVGVTKYQETPAEAIYADNDAKMFVDFATEKLGVSDNRIETLINDEAELTDMLHSIKNWLFRSVKRERTDVYVFFAGHGLASDDGEKMYLLPYDGSPQFLDRTAISSFELFNDIASANPRSVTVFLDTCYSGTTRGPEMLIASRPIVIKAKEQAIPDNFTVFTAAAGDQTANPLLEAEHGMFSYFLMKGMEGDADANQDNQITAGELHTYVEENVIQQSSGSQTPDLQGDTNRVIVQFN